jgi:hypothetical protein
LSKVQSKLEEFEMIAIVDFPLLVFAMALAALWVSAFVGASIRRHRDLEESEHEDLSIVQGAALTLLGLIIGFSFSMAVGRYDLRKNYEAAEANAIGTEYLRASLLPATEASRIQRLLKTYADQRILFYTTRDTRQLENINASTDRLASDLWAAVQGPAAAQPTPLTALVVSGMNEVLDLQGYTQAAWWNRIPTAAWILMLAIGTACNMLVGFNARQHARKRSWFFVLPAIVAISFFLIADMDSPRGGIIRVAPQNLISLSSSLHRQ